MFALIRFLNEFSSALYTVPVGNVKGFNPKDNTDFDKNKKYSVFWDDDDEDLRGYYSAQILMLADTEEQLEERKKSCRVRKPKMNVSEVEGSESEVENAASQRDQTRKENHKKKETQKAARDEAYKRILKEQLRSAKRKMDDAALQRRVVPRKQSTDETSGPEPCWRKQYKEKCKEYSRLMNVVESLQYSIDKRLSSSRCS